MKDFILDDWSNKLHNSDKTAQCNRSFMAQQYTL